MDFTNQCVKYSDEEEEYRKNFLRIQRCLWEPVNLLPEVQNVITKREDQHELIKAGIVDDTELSMEYQFEAKYIPFQEFNPKNSTYG